MKFRTLFLMILIAVTGLTGLSCGKQEKNPPRLPADKITESVSTEEEEGATNDTDTNGDVLTEEDAGEEGNP